MRTERLTTRELVEKRLERARKVRVRLAELNKTQVWLAEEIGKEFCGFKQNS
jgi:hypothetical protein